MGREVGDRYGDVGVGRTTEDSVEGRSTTDHREFIQCVLELHIGPTKLKSPLVLGRPSVSCKKSTCCKSQVLPYRHINLNLDIPKQKKRLEETLAGSTHLLSTSLAGNSHCPLGHASILASSMFPISYVCLHLAHLPFASPSAHPYGPCKSTALLKHCYFFFICLFDA